MKSFMHLFLLLCGGSVSYIFPTIVNPKYTKSIKLTTVEITANVVTFTTLAPHTLKVGSDVSIYTSVLEANTFIATITAVTTSTFSASYTRTNLTSTALTDGYASPIVTIPHCSRPLQEGIKASTIIFSADSGHEQRRQRSNPKRSFNPAYVVLTLDQYRTIRDFYVQVTNVHSFSWTHPIEGTVFNVKFAMDMFTGENFAQGPKGPLYKLTLALEQVFANG